MKRTAYLAIVSLLVSCASASSGPESSPSVDSQISHCDCHDLEPHEALIGTWRSGTANTSLTFEIRPDLTIVVRAMNWRFGSGLIESGNASGHWSAEAGQFSGQLEASSLRSMRDGYTWDDEIVFVSNRYLILRNTLGGFEAYVRE